MNESCNFASVDSLRRKTFDIKIKDLAYKKRNKCQNKLVCVPDSVLQRGCNADVYSVAMLMLELLLGINLFRSSESDLEAVEEHTRQISSELLSALQLMTSGSCTYEQMIAHPFFSFESLS